MDGCSKKAKSRGMCHMHYTRWRLHGDPSITKVGGRPQIPIETRLLNKISPEPNSGCWLYLGALQPNGYARITFNGKTARAHRVSYLIFRGEIPDGLEIDHLCRVRCCVNPDHLEVVSRSINVRRGYDARKGA